VKIGDTAPPSLPIQSGGDPTPESTQAAEGGFTARIEAPSVDASPALDPTVSSSAVDLGARVERGEITAREAIAQAIDATLDAQLGPDVDPAIKDQARALIADALANDPFLASLMRQAGGDA
jgi:hypothetical protein